MLENLAGTNSLNEPFASVAGAVVVIRHSAGRSRDHYRKGLGAILWLEWITFPSTTSDRRHVRGARPGHRGCAAIPMAIT